MIVPIDVTLILRGDDNPFRLPIVFTDETDAPIDMTAWGAKAEVRQYPGQDGAALISITTTAAGGSQIVRSASGVEVRISRAAIQGLPGPAKKGEDAHFVWGLLLTSPNGDQNCWAEGAVIYKLRRVEG